MHTGHCKNKGKKPLNFFSGIVFVSAGLLNLCGIIVYVAHVTEEVGHKARQPRDDPALRYRYGWCVLFSALSFSFMEFAGAMFVYVYIKRFKTSFEKKQQNSHGGGGGGGAAPKTNHYVGNVVSDGRGNGPLLPPPPPPFSSNLRAGERLDEDPEYHDTTIDSSLGVPVGGGGGGGGGGGSRLSAGFKNAGNSGVYHNLPSVDRHMLSASASSSPGVGNYHNHQRGGVNNRSLSRSQDFLNSLDDRERRGGGRGVGYDSRHASLTRGGSSVGGGGGFLSSADYNFVSRNTLSTTADYNKDYSYDTLHRTTPI